MLKAVMAAALALLLFGGGGAWAQPKKGGKGDAKTAAEKLTVPGPQQLAIMVQTSVVALSQANLTGDYSVLHALGSPSFQKANPPKKLAKVFASTRRVDLTPVIIYSPILVRKPVITKGNMLRVTGYYKTSPQQVVFDLLYQPVKGQWRLFGISVGTRPPQAAAAKTEGGGKAKAAKKAAKKK